MSSILLSFFFFFYSNGQIRINSSCIIYCHLCNDCSGFWLQCNRIQIRLSSNIVQWVHNKFIYKIILNVRVLLIFFFKLIISWSLYIYPLNFCLTSLIITLIPGNGQLLNPSHREKTSCFVQSSRCTVFIFIRYACHRCLVQSLVILAFQLTNIFTVENNH